MISERIVSCCLEAFSPHAERPLTSYSPSRRAGLSYERRVTRYLVAERNFYPQLVFRYKLKYEYVEKHAIVDGLSWQLHTNHPALTVYEIKNQLNEQAFKQLEFYIQLVAWWSMLPVRGVLICCEAGSDLLYSNEHPMIDISVVSLRGLKRLERGMVGRGNDYGFARWAAETASVVVRPSRGAGHGSDRGVCVSRVGVEGGKVGT